MVCAERGCYGVDGKLARPAAMKQRERARMCSPNSLSSSVPGVYPSRCIEGWILVRSFASSLGSVPSRNIEPPFGAVTGEQKALAPFPPSLPPLQISPAGRPDVFNFFFFQTPVFPPSLFSFLFSTLFLIQLSLSLFLLVQLLSFFISTVGKLRLFFSFFIFVLIFF